MKPTRWAVRLQLHPGEFIVAAGRPKWGIERLHREMRSVYGGVYIGQSFIPKHMKQKPRFFRMSGTKGFVRIERLHHMLPRDE
jgi:hypothetical protein